MSRNEKDLQDAQNALNQAVLALRKGDRAQTRRWASLAARLDPTNEQAWLIMAGVASPHASVAYLEKALEINPDSSQARRGMEWAMRRLHNVQSQEEKTTLKITVQRPAPPSAQFTSASTQPVTLKRTRPLPMRWPALIISFVFLSLCVLSFTGGMIYLARDGGVQRAIAGFMVTSATPTLQPPSTTPQFEPSRTPIQADTATTTPSITPTNTPQLPDETDVPTATALIVEDAVEETVTPNQVATLTSEPPTDTPEPTIPPPPVVQLPDGVEPGERWIDVDLSDQMVFAYEGTDRVNEFLVSTGTWQYPTVLGQYKVYVKYRYADMSGPGYYLSNVPYVMYFYKGYGLHGTYWHENFGTPMSHGCVNLRTDDAGWLFDWSSVGTVVNVHD